jgi:hypothetical protein
VVASAAPVSYRRLAAAASGSRLAPELRSLALTVVGRMGPALRGGSVYTDDNAPVEWLTDLSIVRYAIGNR